MQKGDFYTVLGVSNNAGFEEIKTAFRSLAKKHHPDKNPGSKTAEEYFKEIQHAYSVLSNPEKRKKYDIKISQERTFTRPNKNTQNTGSANQNTQQKTQQKTPDFSARKPKTKKGGKTESYQILVSFGIAFILLYFIISYSSDNKKDNKRPSVEEKNHSSGTAGKANVTESQKELSAVPLINSFDSPYCGFFGKEVVSEESKNSITIHNSSESEAVVCLVENKKTMKTIRNQYVNFRESFKMNRIPDGEYFLKIYYGSKWDTAVTFLNKKVKGGFSKEIGFAQLNTDKEVLKMKQEEIGQCVSFSSYEIDINPSQKRGAKIITAANFFK